MINVIYSCVSSEHDLRLVTLAAFICIFACFTAVNLFVRTREAVGRRRLLLLSAAAFVFGTGVWATHFVAELAFKPGLPVVYDTWLTALSLLVAVAVVGLGMGVALRFGLAVLGGALIGTGISAMHYIGMVALRVPADLHWSAAYVATSIAVGVIGSALALRVAGKGAAWRYRVLAAILLVVAICGLHFVGMSAISMTPNPLVTIPGNVIAPEVMATLIAVSTIGIIALGMAVSVADEESGRRARIEAEKLRRSEQNLARAQRIAHMGSIVRTIATDAAQCSEEIYRIFGTDPQKWEPSTQNFLSVLLPEDTHKLDAAREDIAAGVAPPPFDYRIRRTDGEVRDIYGETELTHDDSGNVVGYISTLHDVTEARSAERHRAELEAQLRHSQKLEALGTLAGGIAHDLNNTLVPVLALSQMLLETARDEDRVDLETIVDAARRAKQSVTQILAFSRGQEIVKADTDASAAFRNALQELRAQLPPNVALVETIGETPYILANRGQLQQMIVNLVTNAKQAIGTDGGTITVTVEAHEQTRAIEIRVSDTGSGMEPAMLEHIFEPFYTTREVGEGTGLGLSAVHGIVTGHGGKIQVASSPGAGTTFTVTLPEVQDRRTLGVQKILVIDDDPLVRHTLDRLLRKTGYQVELAADGLAGLRVFRTFRPELVITDIAMPVKGGLDTIRLLKEWAPEVKIIAISGGNRLGRLAQGDLLAEAATLGASAVIHKPFELEELLAEAKAQLAAGALATECRAETIGAFQEVERTGP